MSKRKTVLTLRSTDHAALADATKQTLTTVNRPARVVVAKVTKNGGVRTHGVNITFDVFDADLLDVLRRIDFTNTVDVSFRDVV